MFIYFERESVCASGGGAEREAERESQAGSLLPGQSPARAQTHETVRL